MDVVKEFFDKAFNKVESYSKLPLLSVSATFDILDANSKGIEVRVMKA